MRSNEGYETLGVVKLGIIPYKTHLYMILDYAGSRWVTFMGKYSWTSAKNARIAFAYHTGIKLDASEDYRLVEAIYLLEDYGDV